MRSVRLLPVVIFAALALLLGGSGISRATDARQAGRIYGADFWGAGIEVFTSTGSVAAAPRSGSTTSATGPRTCRAS